MPPATGTLRAVVHDKLGDVQDVDVVVAVAGGIENVGVCRVAGPGFSTGLEGKVLAYTPSASPSSTPSTLSTIARSRPNWLSVAPADWAT